MSQLPDATHLKRPRAIDAACDRFEAAYGSDSALTIERVVASVDADVRVKVLREVIRLESELSAGRSEQPTVVDYACRFPQVVDDPIGLNAL